MKDRNLRNTEVSGNSTRQELFEKLIDLRNQIIQESRSEMPSTPHRLEVVATVNGITYINDGAVSGSWWKGPLEGVPEGFGVIDLRPDGTFDHRYETYGWTAQG